MQAIGHEKQTEKSYFWDGNNRSENNCFVFQYTLAGTGAIKINQTVYQLNKNQAFWIEIPSDHSYYLPDDSTNWEFIYITLYGAAVETLYQQLTEKHGHLFTFSDQASVIQFIFKCLRKIEQQQIRNSYQASASGYQFLMTMLESLENNEADSQSFPKPIEKVIAYIKSNYQDDISLTDCVEQANLSKYHFTRQFKKYLGMTPMQYLTDIRIQKATELLLNDQASINEIAKKVGFQNGNYFAKVFKKKTGKAPNTYRKTRLSMAVDHWFTD